MPHSALVFLSFFMISMASAQKVDVFEKASKPEFLHWGKNTVMAQGYGYVILNNGDTLKGTLKVEKKNNTITEYSIKTRKQRFNYAPGEVKSYAFYPYRIFPYDPFLPGNPKFHPGYVITMTGVKIIGQVAVMTVMGTDWLFFPKRIYFIPANAEIASSMAGGELLEVGQTNKDGVSIYDTFGDGYLERIVSGTLRLSYNPNPKLITRPLFYHTSKLPDSIQIKAMQKFVEENINEGKPLNEAIRSGKDVSGIIDVIPVNTEVIEPQYFLKDTRTGKITLLHKETFKGILEPIFSACPGYAKLSGEILEDLYEYNEIEESVKWFNANCK